MERDLRKMVVKARRERDNGAELRKAGGGGGGEYGQEKRKKNGQGKALQLGGG